MVIISVLALGMGGVFLAAQHQSLLARQICFGALTMVEVKALALGSGAAIALPPLIRHSSPLVTLSGGAGS